MAAENDNGTLPALQGEDGKYTMEELEANKVIMQIEQMATEIVRDRVLTQKLAAEARAAKMQADHLAREEENELASFDRHHVYTFVGEVNAKSADLAMMVLEKWHNRDPECDITFIITSPGGDVIAGFALYDYMMWLRRHGHKLITVARGVAASMAGILLQAGEERLTDPNAQFLIHEISGELGGRLSDIGDTKTFFDRLDARGMAILAERSTLTQRQIKGKMSRKDWWLDAEEAVKYGFVDRID